MLIPALITEALKLINLLLEGTSIEQRKSQALIWFWSTWPVTKFFLKLGGTPSNIIDQIEQQMKDTGPVSDSTTTK